MLFGFGMWVFFPKHDPVSEPIRFFLTMGDAGEVSGLVPVERSLRPRQFEILAAAGSGESSVDAAAMQVEIKSEANGQSLFKKEERLTPDGKGAWNLFRREFVPQNEGDHSVTVKVGKPVGSVQVSVDR